MKKHLLSLSLVAAGLLSTSAVAGGPMPDPYTQPGAAHEARVGIHRLMATYLVEFGKMVEGKITHDMGLPLPPTAVEWNGLKAHRMGDHVTDLSHMYEAFMFVPGSYEGTAAKPEIAENKVDFQRHITRLNTASQGLQASIRVHDPVGGFAGVVNTIQSCNACHEKYMEPALLLPVPQPPAMPH